jgi:hypothetical protein
MDILFLKRISDGTVYQFEPSEILHMMCLFLFMSLRTIALRLVMINFLCHVMYSKMQWFSGKPFVILPVHELRKVVKLWMETPCLSA